MISCFLVQRLSKKIYVWRPKQILKLIHYCIKLFFLLTGTLLLKPPNVNFRLKALGLYNFVRGFRRAYKRRGLYPRGVYTSLQGVLGELINGEAYIRGGLHIFVRGFRRAHKRRDLYPRGLYILIRSFRRAYKRRGLYPRGAYNPNRKKRFNQAKVVLIKIRFAFTDFFWFLIMLQNFIINRIHFNVS